MKRCPNTKNSVLERAAVETPGNDIASFHPALPNRRTTRCQRDNIINNIINNTRQLHRPQPTTKREAMMCCSAANREVARLHSFMGRNICRQIRHEDDQQDRFSLPRIRDTAGLCDDGEASVMRCLAMSTLLPAWI